MAGCGGRLVYGTACGLPHIGVDSAIRQPLAGDPGICAQLQPQAGDDRQQRRRSRSACQGGGGKSLKFYRQLAKRFTSGTQEQLPFELVWLMTGRMRDFKLKVYPSLAYVFVFFAYFLLTGRHGSPGEAWNRLPETNMFIFLIYISSFVFLTAISNLMYSDKYKAAWIYYAAPLASPGQLLMGAFKATLIKFFVPFYLVVAAFTLFMWGPKTLPDLVLGFVNVVLINLLFAQIFLRKLPFSSEQNIRQSAGTFLRGLLTLVIPGLIGLGHYVVAGEMWLVGIFALLSVAAFYLLYAKYRETSWERLEV